MVLYIIIVNFLSSFLFLSRSLARSRARLLSLMDTKNIMNAFANDVILNRDYMPNDGIFIKNVTETKTKIETETATETKSLFLQMGLFFLCVRFTTFDFARLEFM